MSSTLGSVLCSLSFISLNTGSNPDGRPAACIVPQELCHYAAIMFHFHFRLFSTVLVMPNDDFVPISIPFWFE